MPTGCWKTTASRKKWFIMFSAPCFSLCASSCLWNNNRFWQICPNCHSCQQAQVRVVFHHLFSLSTVGKMSPSIQHVLIYFSSPTESCRRTWCGHTRQVLNVSVKLTSTTFLDVQCSWRDVRCCSYFCLYVSYVNDMPWCAGVGNPLSPERTRMLLALRINVLAKGYSGISLETLHAMIQAFNGKLQLEPPILLNLSWLELSPSFCWLRYCWLSPWCLVVG